jgi:hypothetical protein
VAVSEGAEKAAALDDVSMKLADAYAKFGYPAFVLRITDAGDTRIMGPRLPRAIVCRMLREAADVWAEHVHDETQN